MRVFADSSCHGCWRSAVLATLLSVNMLCFGCSGGKPPVLDWDTEAVIALKRAGANINQQAAIGVPNLQGETVDLRDVKIDEEILGHLANVENMTELKLTGKSVTDDTLARLAESEAGWKFLRVLDLAGTGITDGGLEHLSDWKKLGILILNDTQVTGAGLAKIPPGISVLHLKRTQIDDDDLQNLQHLKRLQFLGLAGTRVTAAGAKGLKKKHPGVQTIGVRVD